MLQRVDGTSVTNRGNHLLASSLGQALTVRLVALLATVGMMLSVLMTGAAGASAAGATTQAATNDGFVRRSGQQLSLNGAPYRFAGLNIYNANSINNYWYTMGTGDALDRALTDAGPGKNVFRAWFGQWLANPYGSGLDFSAFDHTLSVARAHGYKVIVTFADQDGSWDDGVHKTLDSGWYQGGYKNQVSSAASSWGARNALSYKDYVGRLVQRYQNDPTVLMWQLINEAEAKAADGSCSSATDDASAAAIRGFADDMGAYIKSLDPTHLLSLGSIGTGQCGMSGDRFQTVHASPNIDLTEMHDYVAGQDIIGDQWNGMALRLQQSAALKKPLFVGEMGIDPNQVGGLGNRADRFRAKLAAQFKAGIVGVLAWEWRNGGQNGGDPFVMGPGDPSLVALQLSQASPVPSPSAGGWQTNGTARMMGDSVQLTDATTRDSSGSIFWPKPLSSSSLHISFDATLGGGTGADGLSLAVADAAGGASPSSLGTGGGGLAWSGIPGIAVALDTFRNGRDPADNFVGVATGFDPAQRDSLVWLATNSQVPRLADGTTRRVDVDISADTLSVTLAGNQVLTTRVTLPQSVLIGFTGGDGWLTDRHTISNVSVMGAAG
jgi:mannan endo-1,4-beta-mannosidase